MGKKASRLFRPIIAGATLRDRLVGCLGALLGIGLTDAVCGLLFGADTHLPIIVAPMGAAAVLLFAVPASPLAQPWPIIGGNTISALVGLVVARYVDEPALAAGLAVSLAILAMSFTRSLHPPGGAAALTAVLGGPAVAEMGLAFAFVPVALNSVLLVGLGYVFHRMTGRSYPHVPAPAAADTHGTSDVPAQLRAGFQAEDIDSALAALGEGFDVGRDDLERLLREVVLQAVTRSRGELPCADIMSRDVIAIDRNAGVDEARSLLLRHNIRTLPVVDEAGRLEGAVGLRELTAKEDDVGAVMSAAKTAAPDDPAMNLLHVLTDGSTHGVVVVDADRRVRGVVTQTDLLAAIARMQALQEKPEDAPANRRPRVA